MKASHPCPRRAPVYSVNTREIVRSLVGRKLCGPVYGAGNAPWACAIRFTCPEIHHAAAASCGNIVVSGAVSDVDAGGALCAASMRDVAATIMLMASTCRSLSRQVPRLRMAVVT
jgi:hypothetical protein